MHTDDHQMYVMGKKHDIVVQSIKTLGEQALSWYKNNFSQPRNVSAGTALLTILLTQEMLTQTMLNEIFP